MLILALLGLGLVGILLFALAWRANRRLVEEAAEHAPSLSARRWSWIVAVGLVVASPFLSYPYREGEKAWRIMGVPFPAAAFDASGFDYVGPTTLPAMLGNGVFFGLLPQAALWIAARRRARRVTKTPS